MKNMFRLAAVAVSAALAIGFVACSSGDDVVDATTPKYLMTDKVNSYVDSIEYDQNVSDAEIKSLKDAHKAAMKVVGGCDKCLTVYLYENFDNAKLFTEDSDKYTSGTIKTKKDKLATVQKYTAEQYHKVKVYKKAIEDALENVSKAKPAVDKIGESNGEKILEGKLNDRQLASVNACFDAYKALKEALDEPDAKVNDVKTAIETADATIKNFKNENVTKVYINTGTVAIQKVCEAINTKVVAEIYKLDSEIQASK